LNLLIKSIPTLRRIAAVAVVFASTQVPVQADTNPIYKCFDEHGQLIVTNVRSEMKGRKCERQAEPALPVAPGFKPAARGPGTASPADFPKVDAGTQKARDDMRRKVLTDELANEQNLLQKANQDLDDARKPRPGEDQSSQKHLERVNEAEKAVQRHRQNIDSLQREIATLK
jgi:hypothetical protein